MDDFIKAYNSCYWQDSEAHYLPSASERARDIYNNITHTAYETDAFTFTENEPMCLLPTLPVALRECGHMEIIQVKAAAAFSLSKWTFHCEALGDSPCGGEKGQGNMERNCEKSVNCEIQQ